MAQLKITGLHKHFSGVHAVRGVDLDIPDGEFTVLVGPSGCGKTTLLRTIAGLELADAGTVEIGGEAVNDVRPSDRDVAMVFQNYALYPHMKVYKNIAFGLMARKLPKSEIDERVNRAATMLGISELLSRLPRQLSGGQRQRVAIGRAIVRNPRLFLFDEPLSNLDAQLRDEMRGEIKRLHRDIGATMIYVTHDQIEAMTLADRIVLMRDGQDRTAGCTIGFVRTAGDVDSLQASSARRKMNFIPGELTASGASLPAVHLEDGKILPLPEGRQRTLTVAVGRKVVLGIRPEHIGRAKSPVPRAGYVRVPVAVDLIQPTGSRTYISVPLGGVAATAEVKPHDVAHVGEPIEIDVDMNKAILIDPETNKVI